MWLGKTYFLIASSFLLIVVLSLPSAFALDQHPNISMPYTDNPPIIDGQWTTPDEWKDASRTPMQHGSSSGFLYVEHDRDYLYLMIDDVSDQTKEGGVDSTSNPDYVGFAFDTNNDLSNQFRSGDYYFVVSDREIGGEAPNQLWTKPAQDWAIIQLPSGFSAIAGFSSVNDPNEGGRDHRIYEIKIPLTFLHKQDKFGFSLGINDQTSKTGLHWPDNSDIHVPATYGVLLASDQSVTAPPVPIISVSPQSLSFGNEEVSGKSNPQTVTISNIGTGTLKISSIQAQGEFSMSDTNTPVEIPPKQSISFDVVLVPLTTGEKSGQITVYSNDLSNPVYTLSMSGSGVEKSNSPFGGRCLIATAAFGSEIAPQVQFLREFRDNHILATADGSSFMTAFNAWYYSFSPYVADYERGQPWMQQIVRTSIYPLLGILTASEKAYSIVPGEYGSLSAGLVASSMIGAVYFWPFALTVPQVRKVESRFNYKLAAIVFSIVCVSAVISIIFGNQTVMVITTSLLVLSLIAIFASMSAKVLVKVGNQFSKSIGKLPQKSLS